MSDLKTTGSTHSTLDERQKAVERLEKGMAFKDIAGRIRKASTTVSSSCPTTFAQAHKS